METTFEYIYEMSWYENKRKVNPYQMMYYKEEKHTRWGNDWYKDGEICKIKVVKVLSDSNDLRGAIHNSNNAETKKDYSNLWNDEKSKYVYIYQMDWFYDKYKSKPLFSCSYTKEEHTRWGHEWIKGVNYAEFCSVGVKKVLKNSGAHKMALHFSKLRDEGKDNNESTFKTHKKYIIIDIVVKSKCSIILNTFSLTDEEIGKILKFNNTSTVINKDGENIVNIELEKFIWATGFYGTKKEYDAIKSISEIFKSFKDSVCIYEKHVTMDDNKVSLFIDKFGRDNFNNITINISDKKDVLIF